jgi:polysaccharide export outer membrane protein
MSKRSFCAVVLLLATSCLAVGQEPAQQPAQSAPPVQQPAEQTPPTATKAETPSAPAGLPVAVDPKTFFLGPQDIVFIQVWREPEFTRQAIVRPDGKIGMPLIKDVEASGKTPEALAKDLEKALSEYLKEPEVTVTVLQVNSKKYFVTGQVNRPGAFPLYTPIHVMEALTQSGGFREFANTKKIIILRKGERIKFNYNDVVKGKNLDQDIFVENGDYIVVP